MSLSVHRIITSVSVRTRIIVLAVIPVLGFLINGIAFTAGESEVARAFQNAEHASDLAEASNEFRTMLITMRMKTRDFAARPSHDLIREFEASHAQAVRSLAAIETAVDGSTREKLLPLKSQLGEIAARATISSMHNKFSASRNRREYANAWPRQPPR
jgi:methyl-accepting chemotaxis protein